MLEIRRSQPPIDTDVPKAGSRQRRLILKAIDNSIRLQEVCEAPVEMTLKKRHHSENG